MTTPANTPRARSTTRSGQVTRPRPAVHYELSHEPDGTSWTARENLTDILGRELVGPARGEDEVVHEPPDSLYLLGRIAPQKLAADQDATRKGHQGTLALTEPGDTIQDVAEPDEPLLSSGIPLTENDPGVDTDEDTGPEDQPQKRGLMIPSSMGLRFQVPRDLTQFTVHASWGVYEPFDSGDLNRAGKRITHYRRTPVDKTVVIHTTDLDSGQLPVALHDEVTLLVDAYDDPVSERRFVEIALCNDRVTERRIPVKDWMFQTQLWVEADGTAAFLPVRDVLEDKHFGENSDPEVRRLDIQYRNRLEFAVGRTCSADWTVRAGARTATQVRTTWLPVAETPQTQAREVAATLDMNVLATANADQIRASLTPIVEEYSAWLGERRSEIPSLPPLLREDSSELVAEAEKVRGQLEDGIEFLATNKDAQTCFRFMNRVMADQRLATQVAARRAKDTSLPITGAMDALAEHVGPKAHSWRTFQLAFILMQIRSLVEPTTARRSGLDHVGKVELLFFPTGGGKTEAYLGLAAFTFAIRRLRGVVTSSEGPLDGGSGVGVLMRYTLRLLTAQQFQRATALVCAAELARREDERTWGTEPFRIGLWVGAGVSPKRVAEAAEQKKQLNESGQTKARLSVLQIQRCPWCGTPVEPRNVDIDTDRGRVFVYCGDRSGQCPFAEGGRVNEGLPVLTVDEEIYRLAPVFVIATVDKFARLAREGEAAALFGYVGQKCDRHGYTHPDSTSCTVTTGGHPAKGSLPKAYVRPCARLRPPDLIIQDELHLITGALGTTVGLFEVAIDTMTTWHDPDGAVVKPLIVASTATARNAQDQIKNLYGRGTTIFPPQVLDVADTFFSKEVEISEKHPGRRYVGISTTGVRLSSAEIRVTEVLMSAGQLFLDRCGGAADPYLTLVGYFSSTRELAGMTRYVRDDVTNTLQKGRPWTGLPRRYGTEFGQLNLAELTSRINSADITDTLDQMAVAFDPDVDSTRARAEFLAARDAGNPLPKKRERNPFDVVLATSMLQVGVDVSRLGLMLVVGQPKNTAEYIQASSRVGREADRPGLVVTLGNWARPRDLAHFEQFRHYHQTFYAQVEALSVTPFSPTSIERGIDGVLVSAARVLQAPVKDGLSPERNAGRVNEQLPFLGRLVDGLTARVERAGEPGAEDRARRELLNRVDLWTRRRADVAARHKSLVYERASTAQPFETLILSAENASRRTSGRRPPFVIANSMREVQPEINVLVSPIEENLFIPPRASDPPWVLADMDEGDNDDD